MRNKIVAFAFIFIILIFCFTNAFASENLCIYLTDPSNDKTYLIDYKDKELSVIHNDNTLGTTYLQDAHSFSVFDNILYAYYADGINHHILVYCFDFYNDSMESFAVNENAFINETCFASDGNTHYFVWGDDTKKLCVLEKGNVNRINFKSEIQSILLLDEDMLIAVCSGGSFIYNKGEIFKTTSSLSPALKYIGDGIFSDSTGREFYVENLEIKESDSDETTFTTEAKLTEIPEELKTGFYITEKGVTVNKIKKAFVNLEIIRFTKADGKDITGVKLGTGATFTLASGEVITVIIYGELTGEGNINSRDLNAILNHLSRKELLKGSFLISADIDLDGVITTKDALKLSQMY